MVSPLAFDLKHSISAVGALFAMDAALRPGMGPKDHAAWVMNVLAHGLGPWLAARDLSGGLGRLQDGLRLMARIAPEGYLVFEPLDPAPQETPDAPQPELLPEQAARAVALLFAAPVGAFAFAGGLAPAALWRIVGDGMGWGFVQTGQPARGQRILTSPGAPFANRQLRLEPDRVAQRGGCCRWLSVNGETCANCPLRKPD